MRINIWSVYINTIVHVKVVLKNHYPVKQCTYAPNENM